MSDRRILDALTELRFVGRRKRLFALAAGSGTAKTPKAVECEASQSGGEAVTPKPRGKGHRQ